MASEVKPEARLIGLEGNVILDLLGQDRLIALSTFKFAKRLTLKFLSAMSFSRDISLCACD